MSSLLCNIAFFHYKYQITVLNSGKTVSYDIRSTVLCKFFKRLLNTFFGQNIDIACRLIKYHDRRVHQHNA